MNTFHIDEGGFTGHNLLDSQPHFQGADNFSFQERADLACRPASGRKQTLMPTGSNTH